MVKWGERVNKSSKILLILLLIILSSSTLTFAAKAEFRLDIDSLNLVEGVSSNLTLSLKNAQGAEVEEIKGIDKFKILSKGTSSQTNIINFKKSYIKKYHYNILAEKAGKFTLQGIVKYKGKLYKTNELNLTVSKRGRNQKKENTNIFLRTTLSKDRIYFGEKVVLKYDLFTRYNLRGYQFAEELKFNNFISQSLGNNQLKASYVYLDGKKYIKYEVAQLILTPTKTGEVKIPSYNLQTNVSTGSFSSKAIYLSTDAKDIKVLPLPQTKRPKGFTGIVGSLDIKSNLSKQKVEYGDSTTLNVKLSGNVNLDSVENIFGDKISGFEAYQTEKDNKEEVRGMEYYTEKDFDIILVPNKKGKLEIPEIKIAYFNPQSQKYEYAKIKKSTIEVSGGEGKGDDDQNLIDDSQSNNKEVIKITQINDQSNTDTNEEYYSFRIKKFYLKIAVIILTVTVLLLIIIIILRRNKLKKDNNLAKIYEKIRKEDNEDKIYNLLNQMIKYRFNISLKANSKHEISNKIDDIDLLRELYEIIDYMENKRYEARDLEVQDKISTIYKML
ncbi:oxygen tolerance protein BatD [Orenia marismortui]|uniref:Oxygen tolerance protein BatD n=1 Tax=Orenia marismortui TaxID=46469 RepID=A0A4R8H5W9_9FIRM|nr:oxygen tolerance protein BatD [Orenia marismortui]